MVKKSIHMVILFFLITGMLFSTRVVMAEPEAKRIKNQAETGDFAPGRLLIRFKDDVTASEAADALGDHQSGFIETLYESQIQVIEVPEGEELALMEKYKTDPRVAYVEPDYIFKADMVPNDPSYGAQWGLGKINAPAAWDITTGDSSVIVAVLDSGVDLDHPDLADKIVNGIDYVDDDSTPQDTNGHGTHVAGIIGASSNNGIGITGVSWGARIMPVRVLDSNGSGYLSDIVSGINWACSNGAKVLNLSLGGRTDSESLKTAVDNAYASGCFVVASAGNCGDSYYSYNGCTYMNQPSYPGAYDHVFAVAATTSSDGHASFSTQGSYVDIAAPGKDIYSTMYNNTYTYKDGTSQAAPFVSGLAALILSIKPGFSPDQVRQVIESTAVDLGSVGVDDFYGVGRINILAALQSISLPPATLAAIINPENDGNYTLSWSVSSGATSYMLQEDDAPDFSSPVIRYLGAGTQTSVSGQSIGLWHYRVKALSSSAESPWSSAVSTLVRPAAPVLSAISNPTGSDQFLVDWSDVPEAYGYRLEQSADPAFSTASVIFVGAASQYQVTGQTGGTWYFRAFSLAGVHESLASNVASATVTVSGLSAPFMDVISNSDGNGDFVVSWQTVASATGYILEKSATAYFDQPVQVYSGPLTQYNAVSMPEGRWYFRVRATSAAGNSPWSTSRLAIVTIHILLPMIVK
ncbi:MAG TPA: S8 family serine peptidase [Anaerolineaceae bacterium]|nr:S8 family serine peptidase [Anaerolineaceae bacterium]